MRVNLSGKKEKRFLCYKNISRLLIPLSRIKKKKRKEKKEYNYVEKACSLKQDWYFNDL